MAAVLSPVPEFRPKRFSSFRTEAAFFQLVNRIGRLNEPTQTQLDTLARAYDSTSDFLASADEFKGLLLEIHPHGSRQLGTMVRPLDESRDGFDVDAIARLDHRAWAKYGTNGGAVVLLRDLSSVMRRYADAFGLTLIRDDRCITLQYAEGMTVDYAPVLDYPSLLGEFGDTRGFIPDRQFKMFDETNPHGFGKCFNRAAAIHANFGTQFIRGAMDTLDRASVTPLSDADEVFDRLLCRLVQLLKLHLRLHYNSTPGLADLAPSSMFITTLAANAYMTLAPQFHDSPLDLLLDIVDNLKNFVKVQYALDGTPVWLLPNPSVPSENLASSMNTTLKQEAFAVWHRQAQADIGAIVDAIDVSAGRDEVLSKVQKAFGSRAVHALRGQDTRAMQASRSSGTTAIFPSIAAGASATAISTSARAHTFFGE